MYDKIIRTLAPVTGNMYDYIAMSFPIPTEKGICVIYYNSKTAELESKRKIAVVKVILVNGTHYEEKPLHELFSTECTENFYIEDTVGEFAEIYRQRKACEKSLNGLLALSENDSLCFNAFTSEHKDLIARFLEDIMRYASMSGLESMYDAILGDLKEQFLIL